MKIMSSPSGSDNKDPPVVMQAVVSDGIDLETCSPAEYAMFLLHRQPRFRNNELCLTEFLMEAVASLPHAEEIRDQLLQQHAEEQENDDEHDEEEEKSEQLQPLEKPVLSTVVSCWQPIRGKLRLDLYSEKGVLLTDEKSQSSFPIQSARDIVIFPKPEDITNKRKTISHMLLIVLDENQLFKNKQIFQVVLQIPNADDAAAAVGDAKSWTIQLAKVLRYSATNIHCIGTIGKEDGSTVKYEFNSYSDTSLSLTTAGLPFVSCFYNTHDGVLFPTSHGLLFTKPVVYLPRRKLASIQCAGTNRYVTMTVQTTSNSSSHDDDNQHGEEKYIEGATYEFTNISTQERDGLDRYIQNTLIPAMKLDMDHPMKDDDGDEVNASAKDVSLAVLEESDGNGPRGTKRRRAAVQAQIINRRSVQNTNNANGKTDHDDDDDEDEEDGEYGVGESSSSDDDDDAQDKDDNSDQEVDSSVDAEIDEEQSDTESDNDD
jgi:hypothetical protein